MPGMTRPRMCLLPRCPDLATDWFEEFPLCAKHYALAVQDPALRPGLRKIERKYRRERLWTCWGAFVALSAVELLIARVAGWGWPIQALVVFYAGFCIWLGAYLAMKRADREARGR